MVEVVLMTVGDPGLLINLKIDLRKMISLSVDFVYLVDQLAISQKTIVGMNIDQEMKDVIVMKGIHLDPEKVVEIQENGYEVEKETSVI